jgi:hypothetical protein
MRRSILKVKKVPNETLDFERFSLFESCFKDKEIFRFENAKNLPHTINLKVDGNEKRGGSGRT